MTTHRQRLTTTEINQLVAHYRNGASKRELARGYGVSRNAVTKFVQYADKHEGKQ